MDNTGDILGQLGKTSAWPTYRQLFKSQLHSLNSTTVLHYCLLLHHVRCIKRFAYETSMSRQGAIKNSK